MSTGLNRHKLRRERQALAMLGHTLYLMGLRMQGKSPPEETKPEFKPNPKVAGMLALMAGL